MKIAILGKIHPDGLEFLRSKNFEVLEINSFEENKLTPLIADVEGIVIRTADLKENLLSKCKNLKIVARHGVDTITLI